MTCPIGLRGIVGKEPGIIAVAVAAELLQRRAVLAAAEEGSADGGNASPREGSAATRFA
jgi:xanthine/CO dehydrogenase XdhC/CoxF family maturation factor